MMQRPVFFSSQPTPFLVLFQENKKSCAETKFQHSPFSYQRFSIANSMQNLIDTASQVTQQKPINLTDFKNPSMDQFFGGSIQTSNGGLI